MKQKKNSPFLEKVGGGGLSRKPEETSLKKFTKNKKEKRIIIGSVLGILILIGGLFLYKTYAYYEEEKEFNVLKGTIPDYDYNVKIVSVIVNGKEDKIPERGLYKTKIDCTNGVEGKWDYNDWTLDLENVVKTSECSLVFTSNLTEEEYNTYIEAGKALHRNTYRGKDITSYLTDGSLYTRISNGSFEDIYVGDYIVANNVTWLIADIDNYLYSGDTALTKHHATIIPAKPLTTARMNASNTTEGGYVGSEMVSTHLTNALNTYIKPVFGSHILTYRNLLTNSVNASAQSAVGAGWTGTSNGWSWYDRQLDLISESNVYGSDKFSSSAYDTGIDNRQYALFQLKPEYINSYKNERYNYWLKNVSGSTTFAYVDVGGNSDSSGASAGCGLRPRVLIG